ncbi:MAG: FGGY family carbohydrate kinase [Gemmobacter sp.]
MRVACIDQGTTSTRCLVVQDGGAWHVAAALRHGQSHPVPGWVEHDPEELIANIRAVLAAAGPVDAIAIANQGESCLAWDASSGEALSPVIVWQDARTSDALAALPPDATTLSTAISGLPLDPYFSASKLAWMLHNIPAVADARARGTLRLGTTDAFFLDRLAGTFATDRATASRTGLLDLGTGDWSRALCDLHGVPMDCLPRIADTDAGFGDIGGVPVAVSTVDQQAALFGHGCAAPGDGKITFGTGAFLLAVTGDSRPATGDLLPTVAWSRQGKGTTFAVEGGVYDAGAALEWARRIGLWDTPADLAAFDGPSALSRGIVFVPALSGLAAPWWDRTASPLFIGMDQATTRTDLTRAVLEGIAMLTAGLVRAVGGDAGRAISIDGGLSRSPFFAQVLANACHRAITVPPMHELTALGLAALCGLDVAPARAGGVTYVPDGSITDADEARFAEALNRSRGWRGQG